MYEDERMKETIETYDKTAVKYQSLYLLPSGRVPFWWFNGCRIWNSRFTAEGLSWAGWDVPYRYDLYCILVKGSTVILQGYAVCSDEVLNNVRAIWIAEIIKDKVSLWHIYPDTEQNRERWGLWGLYKRVSKSRWFLLYSKINKRYSKFHLWA